MLRRRPSARSGVKRHLVRWPDGMLTAADDGAVVTIDELRDGLQAGRYFRAARSASGDDCTSEVLAEVIRSAVPDVDTSMLALQDPLLRLLGEADGRS